MELVSRIQVKFRFNILKKTQGRNFILLALQTYLKVYIF